MPAIQTTPTPNPNSLKFTADGASFIDGGMLTFSSAEEAEGDVLGERLFSLPGVANVFVLPAFMTLTKHPAADWDLLLPKVEEVLQDYLADR